MNPIDPTLLDGLVDGELDPESRARLLRQLDGTPDGWKRCALAFLEAQEFGLAARAWTSAHARPAPLPATRPRRVTPTRLALAASLAAVAFLAGFAARGFPTPAPAPAPEASPQLLAESDSPALPPSLAPRTPPEPAPPTMSAREDPPPMPEYVRAQWTRQGYQVERTHKLISMEEDGRTVRVPVDEYRLEFVGRPVY